MGFEPTSAQGNHTLSTRLSQPSFSSSNKTWATNHCLIPFEFHLRRRADEGYFRFILHRLISRFGTTSSERCLVALSYSAIKPKPTMLQLGSESVIVFAN